MKPYTGSQVSKNGTVLLQKAPGFPCQLNVAEEQIKTNSDECLPPGIDIICILLRKSLPPGISIIKVEITGNIEAKNVATPVHHYDLNDISYSIPATVLSGSSGYLKIINTGEKDINWKESLVTC
ncbi:hypothetical protein PYW07_001650 [Mythimna separata]|uniref:Uncharacterized protein n=1 Tax=Mythimna separata TaxID=271217 RepID=A0AAD7YTJ2_MYTSE|nr:hypothetical protein PYW07_001650 [Mythimna separata]